MPGAFPVDPKIDRITGKPRCKNQVSTMKAYRTDSRMTGYSTGTSTTETNSGFNRPLTPGVMRKFGLLTVISAMVLLLAPAAHAQVGLERTKKTQRFHAGITIGPEITKLKIKLKDGSTPTADAKIGFHIGLALGLDFGPLTVRSGVNFVNAGALFDGTEAFSRNELNASFVTVPVDIRLRPLGTHLLTPYIFAGPEFRYTLDLSERPIAIDEDFRLLNATFSMGVGVSLRIPKVPFRFSPEIRYVTDMTGYYGGRLETDDGDFVETASAIKANALRVGMLLGF